MTDQYTTLKEHGLKLTRQRCEILEALEDSPPLKAEEICSLVSKHCRINLSTIYRNLNILLRMGLIRKVNSPDQADQYELIRHTCKHSLECLKCGAKVIFTECAFDQMVQAVEQKTNYKVKKHNFELYGTCPNCLNKG
jgi:Fe2+ or Zn2+ uptake regulation protein